MSRDDARQPWSARLALALYPPAWRDRYRDEVLALLAESGSGPRAAASLAWHAVPAWICPPRHLHADPSARMRSSLATVLLSWSVLACFGLAFAQLAQLKGAVPPVVTPWSHPAVPVTAYTEIVVWCYRVFDAALITSALAIGIGGLPLWLVMLRRARRQYRQRDVARLLMPILVLACYLVVAVMTVPHLDDPLGPAGWWFLAFLLASWVTGIAAAAGPRLVLRAMEPRGPAVRWASRTSALGVTSVIVASLASGTAATTMHLYDHLARDEVAYLSPIVYSHYAATELFRSSTLLVVYLALVLAVAAVAAVSAARGARAALAQPN